MSTTGPHIVNLVAKVNGAAADGEVVTFNFIRPDTTPDQAQVTLGAAAADGSRSGTGTYSAPQDGTYHWSATIALDAGFSAASTPDATFAISDILTVRTLTAGATP